MLRVVTDETDKVRQGKFFCLGRIVLVEGLPYRVLGTHPKLGVAVEQSHKFSRYRGDCRLVAPTGFIRVVTRMDTPKSDCHLHSKYMIGVL